MMEWRPIETAPKDGTEVEFMNSQTGQYDKGYWHDYTQRGGSMSGIHGEWDTVLGNGNMTHWRSIIPRN